MIIGIPKEIKQNENRVAITPANVKTLVLLGHTVIVESKAGLGSIFKDEEYAAAGAQIFSNPSDIWTQADMIIKVKEPLKEEYQFFRDDLILFTYLHLAPNPELTNALLDSRVIGIAYETVQLENYALPLLAPMSEIAGRMSIQVGAQILTSHAGGKGLLLGGVAGVQAGYIMILGGGIVGINAAKMAVGIGAQVTILDTNIERLRYIDDIFGARVQTLMSNAYNIAETVKKADLVVGAVLIPGARSPKLITESMVQTMSTGSAIIDVAIDQGGSVETIDHITTHENPTFTKHGIIHYSVANMPGAVPRTSTIALTNATMGYITEIAQKGWQQACIENSALARGINTLKGKCCYNGVAKAQNINYTPYTDLL